MGHDSPAGSGPYAETEETTFEAQGLMAWLKPSAASLCDRVWHTCAPGFRPRLKPCAATLCDLVWYTCAQGCRPWLKPCAGSLCDLVWHTCAVCFGSRRSTLSPTHIPGGTRHNKKKGDTEDKSGGLLLYLGGQHNVRKFLVSQLVRSS